MGKGEMNIVNRNIIIVTIVVILIVAFTGFLNIYRPKLAKLEELEGLMKEEQEKNVLKEKLDNLYKILARYQERAINKNHLPWFIKELTGKAKDFQVEIVKIEPLSSVEYPAYLQLPVRIKAKCGYHELGDLVSWIESQKMFVKIDDLKLKTKADEILNCLTRQAQ